MAGEHAGKKGTRADSNDEFKMVLAVPRATTTVGYNRDRTKR